MKENMDKPVSPNEDLPRFYQACSTLLKSSPEITKTGLPLRRCSSSDQHKYKKRDYLLPEGQTVIEKSVQLKSKRSQTLGYYQPNVDLYLALFIQLRNLLLITAKRFEYSRKVSENIDLKLSCVEAEQRIRDKERKVADLQELYIHQHHMREGATKLIESLEHRYNINQSRIEECRLQRQINAERLLLIEEEISKMSGSLKFKVLGLYGFSRISPGDTYELTFKIGSHQKWKSKCKVEVHGQRWIEPLFVFQADVSKSMTIKLAELGSFGKTTGIGEATCYVQEFLSPEPKVFLIPINAIGTMKVKLGVAWSGLDKTDRKFLSSQKRNPEMSDVDFTNAGVVNLTSFGRNPPKPEDRSLIQIPNLLPPNTPSTSTPTSSNSSSSSTPSLGGSGGRTQSSPLPRPNRTSNVSLDNDIQTPNQGLENVRKSSIQGSEMTRKMSSQERPDRERTESSPFPRPKRTPGKHGIDTTDLAEELAGYRKVSATVVDAKAQTLPAHAQGNKTPQTEPRKISNTPDSTQRNDSNNKTPLTDKTTRPKNNSDTRLSESITVTSSPIPANKTPQQKKLSSATSSSGGTSIELSITPTKKNSVSNMATKQNTSITVEKSPVPININKKKSIDEPIKNETPKTSKNNNGHIKTTNVAKVASPSNTPKTKQNSQIKADRKTPVSSAQKSGSKTPTSTSKNLTGQQKTPQQKTPQHKQNGQTKISVEKTPTPKPRPNGQIKNTTESSKSKSSSHIKSTEQKTPNTKAETPKASSTGQLLKERNKSPIVSVQKTPNDTRKISAEVRSSNDMPDPIYDNKKDSSLDHNKNILPVNLSCESSLDRSAGGSPKVIKSKPIEAKKVNTKEKESSVLKSEPKKAPSPVVKHKQHKHLQKENSTPVTSKSHTPNQPSQFVTSGSVAVRSSNQNTSLASRAQNIDVTNDELSQSWPIQSNNWFKETLSRQLLGSNNGKEAPPVPRGPPIGQKPRKTSKLGPFQDSELSDSNLAIQNCLNVCQHIITQLTAKPFIKELAENVEDEMKVLIKAIESFQSRQNRRPSFSESVVIALSSFDFLNKDEEDEDPGTLRGQSPTLYILPIQWKRVHRALFHHLCVLFDLIDVFEKKYGPLQHVAKVTQAAIVRNIKTIRELKRLISEPEEINLQTVCEKYVQSETLGNTWEVSAATDQPLFCNRAAINMTMSALYNHLRTSTETANTLQVQANEVCSAALKHLMGDEQSLTDQDVITVFDFVEFFKRKVQSHNVAEFLQHVKMEITALKGLEATDELVVKSTLQQYWHIPIIPSCIQALFKLLSQGKTTTKANTVNALKQVHKTTATYLEDIIALSLEHKNTPVIVGACLAAGELRLNSFSEKLRYIHDVGNSVVKDAADYSLKRLGHSYIKS
ncbi:rho family-interacting cell polarization regulator 1-like isoform X1 [Clytia hemisphaerica]|uniref:rho family-interacting cell polarization regulator 1-like isoform X1 n=1 Tax=Clytia hemisphaerica TaxID=252671 RepID=UPI0034D41132